jgi:hypothetical protein
MKEEGIYQRALATAIEQAANSQLAVKEHLRRLAFMKAERAWKECIGNEYESEELGTVKAVAVGFKTKDDIFKLERYNNTEDAIIVFIVFAVDVQSLIDNKRKQLTDAERKSLKEIKSIRNEADYCKNNPWYSQYSESRSCKIDTFQRINDDFRKRKNKLKVLDIAQWSWSLSDVLADSFIEKGMNYDRQMICKSYM